MSGRVVTATAYPFAAVGMAPVRLLRPLGGWFPLPRRLRDPDDEAQVEGAADAFFAHRQRLAHILDDHLNAFADGLERRFERRCAARMTRVEETAHLLLILAEPGGEIRR